MKDGFFKKKIVGLVIFVCLLVIILGVSAILIIKNEANKKEEDEVILIPEEERNEIENKISEYQARIDAANKEDVKNIYMERVFYLTECAYAEEYKEKILDDLIKIDDIEKSISSAGNVINYANYFKMKEIIEQYKKILEERKEAEGYEKILEDVG